MRLKRQASSHLEPINANTAGIDIGVNGFLFPQIEPQKMSEVLAVLQQT